MTPERWQQVKELFYSALEREPSQRTAFLDQACAGDEELRKEVESLIASHEKTGSFIDAPGTVDLRKYVLAPRSYYEKKGMYVEAIAEYQRECFRR